MSQLVDWALKFPTDRPSSISNLLNAKLISSFPNQIYFTIGRIVFHSQPKDYVFNSPGSNLQAKEIVNNQEAVDPKAR
jgi:hypothetical protein